MPTVKRPEDPHCQGSICLRSLRRDASGDVWFTVEWSTTHGRIQSKGWKWIMSQNRFDARCGGSYTAKVAQDARVVIRRLLTKLVLDRWGYSIPNPRREAHLKGKHVATAEEEREPLRTRTEADKSPEGS